MLNYFMIDLHYFWIGPKATGNYLAMDAVGPVLTRKKYPAQPIYFWCLAEYKDYFQSQFEQKDIEVCAIEPFIQQKIDALSLENDELIEALTKLFTFIENQKERVKTSALCPEDINFAYISIKDAMQYLLPVFFDGYFMDSNIIPDNEEVNGIYESSHFLVPLILKRSIYTSTGTISPIDDLTIDPWLVVSPESDSNKRSRFLDYFYRFEKAQDAFLENPNLDELRNNMANAFIHPPIASFSLYHETSLASDSPYIAKKKTRTIRSYLGFCKRYTNSHKHKKTSNQSLLFNACLDEDRFDIEEVKFYLQAGHDAQSVINELVFINYQERLIAMLPYLDKAFMNNFFRQLSFSDFIKDKYAPGCREIFFIEFIKNCFDTENEFFYLLDNIMGLLGCTESKKINPPITDSAIENQIEILLDCSQKKLNPTLNEVIDWICYFGPVNEESASEYCKKIKSKLSPSTISPALSFQGNVITVDEIKAILFDPEKTVPKSKRIKI